MGDYLSWDLGALISYTVGEELECTPTFSAPQDGTYYLLGALYTPQLAYIPGTMFGVLLPSGEEYAVNSAEHMTTWELEEAGEAEQACKFILERTNAIFGLFLMRLVNEEASLENDEVVDSVSVSLSGPAAEKGLDIGSLMMMVMVVGIMSMMMTAALKD